jgi:dCMP deaminase
VIAVRDPAHDLNAPPGGCSGSPSAAPSVDPFGFALLFAPGFGALLGVALLQDRRHGEANALIHAAYHGVAVSGGTLYTTVCPCLIRTKMIINSGLAEVVYNADYPMGDVSLSLLREAGVKVRQVALGGEGATPR